MMFLVGLMGLMAVGATAVYGLDAGGSADEDDDTTNPTLDEDTQAGNDTSGTLDLLHAPEPDVLPNGDTGGVRAWGNALNDTLEGTENPDLLNGYQGDDRVSGLEGGDQIHGEDGNDTLLGNEGDDTLHGEDGNDELHGGAGNDALFGHNDSDTLYGGAGQDSLVGSEGNDHLFGGEGDDALHGDIGNDTLEGGSGADTLFGGWGDDVISGVTANGASDTATDYLNGGGGDDLIIAGNSDIVTAGEGADSIALGDWLSQEHQAEIMDFSAEEDSIMIVYDDQSGNEPDVTLEQDEDDPTRQHVVLNGERIASVANATGLSLAQVVLVGQSALAAP